MEVFVIVDIVILQTNQALMQLARCKQELWSRVHRQQLQKGFLQSSSCWNDKITKENRLVSFLWHFCTMKSVQRRLTRRGVDRTYLQVHSLNAQRAQDDERGLGCQHGSAWTCWHDSGDQSPSDGLWTPPNLCDQPLHLPGQSLASSIDPTGLCCVLYNTASS